MTQMEDDARIPHRRPASKPYGNYSAPIRPKPNPHNMRKFTKGPENIAVGKQRSKPMRRDPYDPMTYSDVFGGPPRCIYSRYQADEPCIPISYDEVFRAFERELNLSAGSSLPVFELPLYENSSLPVLELPVFGGSELPVYEVPSCGEDLGSTVTMPRASGDDFYGDIFRGVDAISSSFCEESATKSSISRPSRSRSKSPASSQPSSEKRSLHRPLLSWMTEDQSLSAFTSKLRPIAVSPKQDRSLSFGLPYRQGVGYPSRDSNTVSVISSSCSSPSKTNFTEPPGVAYSHFNKPPAYSNGPDRPKMDDVFGGFPQQRHFTFLQSSQQKEEPVNEVKIGTTLTNLDTSDMYEKKYPVLLNTKRKSSSNCRYVVGEHCNDLAPREQMHLMTQHLPSPTPSQSPSAPQKMKPWKDWMPELNNSYVHQKRGLYSSSFQESSYVSPTIEGSDGTEEKSPRSRLETLGENLLDDGEGSDVHESYVIEIVSEIKKNLTFHDENANYADDNLMPDASDIAMKEAIAWAKEKFQSGRWEEGQEEVAECSQGPEGKDAPPLMHKSPEVDENTESIIQDGNDAIRNTERRMQKPSTKGVPQGTFESSEDPGRGLINQFKHISPSHQQLSICMKEREEHTQEIKSYPFKGQCTPINAHQKLSTEAPNDVTAIYYQQAMHHDDMDPLFHTPELQGASTIDTTFDIVNMIGLCNLWEERTCYELSVPSSDVQSTTLKEIPERRTQSELGHQWEHKHAMCDEIRLFMHNGNQRVFS